MTRVTLNIDGIRMSQDAIFPGYSLDFSVSRQVEVYSRTISAFRCLTINYREPNDHLPLAWTSVKRELRVVTISATQAMLNAPEDVFLGTMAHEFGHLVCGHAKHFLLNLPPRELWELQEEADFAGGMLVGFDKIYHSLEYILLAIPSVFHLLYPRMEKVRLWGMTNPDILLEKRRFMKLEKQDIEENLNGLDLL